MRCGRAILAPWPVMPGWRWKLHAAPCVVDKNGNKSLRAPYSASFFFERGDVPMFMAYGLKYQSI